MSHNAYLTVSVGLGSRSYDILVGEDLLNKPSRPLTQLVGGRRCAVVTDDTVAKLHLKPFMAMLKKLGARVDTITLPAGESTKSFAQLENLCHQILDLKITRNDMIVALGGGVIGDLTGFAAAITRRGIDFIQVPTTLLAQVDSSVGGKTAINVAQGKNLIGAFYQPRLVLADTKALSTLPERERMAGFAEIVKYGLICDPQFFNWLNQNGKKVLACDSEALRHSVARSCQIKADVVAADERETGKRALLNLGHTFGHAIEAHGGFDGRILHGEAVSIGMVMAHQVSHSLGHMASKDLDIVLETFQALGLPRRVERFGLKGLTASEMIRHMAQDKKNMDDRITLILSRGIGQAFLTRDVGAAVLEPMIEKILSAEQAGPL
ncbi:MAG: 3-dehydroquinate synthase [Pseudomonadota bacterium]